LLAADEFFDLLKVRDYLLGQFSSVYRSSASTPRKKHETFSREVSEPGRVARTSSLQMIVPWSCAPLPKQHGRRVIGKLERLSSGLERPLSESRAAPRRFLMTTTLASGRFVLRRHGSEWSKVCVCWMLAIQRR
jgi:hypothetical protein